MFIEYLILLALIESNAITLGLDYHFALNAYCWGKAILAILKPLESH